MKRCVRCVRCVREEGDQAEERRGRDEVSEEEWEGIGERTAVGFPSPAELDRRGRLDVGRYLVRRPGTTFFARMEGESLRGEGIEEGDLLVIDRAEPMMGGQMVVVRVGEQILVRRVERREEEWALVAAGQPVILLEGAGEEESAWEYWGRVLFSIRAF
jgi:DNA polymerase V